MCPCLTQLLLGVPLRGGIHGWVGTKSWIHNEVIAWAVARVKGARKVVYHFKRNIKLKQSADVRYLQYWRRLLFVCWLLLMNIGCIYMYRRLKSRKSNGSILVRHTEEGKDYNLCRNTHAHCHLRPSWNNTHRPFSWRHVLSESSHQILHSKVQSAS